ncbi:MAG: hypothetical protein MJZ20_01315 [Bacteroidaceae bacterium]|nr:hypothetical protein [Bacteroidaceae bacterium]
MLLRLVIWFLICYILIGMLFGKEIGKRCGYNSWSYLSFLLTWPPYVNKAFKDIYGATKDELERRKEQHDDIVDDNKED